GGSGTMVSTNEGEVAFAALASYPVADGTCRIFTLGGPSPIRAVACTDGGPWQVTVAATESAGAFTPASETALGSIDAWLDSAEAGAALSPDEEAALIAGGWREP